jgi:hypothetical protein
MAAKKASSRKSSRKKYSKGAGKRVESAMRRRKRVPSEESPAAVEK